MEAWQFKSNEPTDSETDGDLFPWVQVAPSHSVCSWSKKGSSPRPLCQLSAHNLIPSQSHTAQHFLGKQILTQKFVETQAFRPQHRDEEVILNLWVAALGHGTILPQGSPKTIPKHRHLHHDSQNYQNYSYEETMQWFYSSSLHEELY